MRSGAIRMPLSPVITSSTRQHHTTEWVDLGDLDPDELCPPSEGTCTIDENSSLNSFQVVSAQEVIEACKKEVLEKEDHSRPVFDAARVPPRMPMCLSLWTGVDGAGKPVLPDRKCWCEYLTGQICVHCQDKLESAKVGKA